MPSYLESATSVKSKTTVYPIEGATGRFAGARGTGTVTGAGANGSLVTIRHRR
jgi:hypothetical protein